METLAIPLKHVALCDLTLELERCFTESYWVYKALFLIAAIYVTKSNSFQNRLIYHVSILTTHCLLSLLAILFQQ